MNSPPRPPPTVLLVHDGVSVQSHFNYLSAAGLNVSQIGGPSAVAEALRLQPDLIVLDFGCDGEVTAALKAHTGTTHIPVIALVDMMP